MNNKEAGVERILCLGDSITEGTGSGGRRRWSNILQTRLQMKKPRAAVSVVNRGKAGNTSADILERCGTELLPDLPALVLLQCGFNDANVRSWLQVPRLSLDEFQRNIIEIHRLVKTGGGRMALIANHQPSARDLQGNGKSFVENYHPFQKVIRKTAARLGVPLFDIEKLFAKGGGDPSRLVGSDGIHLSEDGHAEYADMVYPLVERLLAV